MPMIWRILTCVNFLNRQKNLDLGLPQIVLVYDLQTFGSHHIMFKIKTGQDYMINKATHHGLEWKGRYFSVKKDSLPDVDRIPLEWALKVPKLVARFPVGATSMVKIEEFLKIPTAERSFKSQITTQSVEEESKSAISSTSKMSIVPRSTRSGTHFGLSNMDNLLVVKKEGKGSLVRKEHSCQVVLGGKKRKSDVEVINIEIFYSIEPREVKKKC